MTPLEKLHEHFLQSSGVTTDTRKITKGSIFFALKGANFNGNKFASKALETGSSYAVVDEKEFAVSEKYILVDDVLTTLQQLATHHRRQFNIPFIGITGSNGKTTTKELITTVLKQKYKTIATAGNLNNHIGVPLTLLSIPKDTEMAVIEMGANKIGDIEELCNIAEPNYGIITNIGKAHLEGFGSLEGVARGKSELYLHILKNGGTTFVNGNNEILLRMSQRLTDVVYFLGNPKGDYYNVELVKEEPFLSLKDNTGKIYDTHLSGFYNFENMVSALCIGEYFKVNHQKAFEAVSNYTPDNNRSQLTEKGNNKIILDAYNANPTSMRFAIESFLKNESKNKVLILGDMFELGNQSKEEHQNIVNLLDEQQSKFHSAFLLGKHFNSCQNERFKFFENKDELIASDKLKSLNNATILVKGSRGMGLESLLGELPE